MNTALTSNLSLLVGLRCYRGNRTNRSPCTVAAVTTEDGHLYLHLIADDGATFRNLFQEVEFFGSFAHRLSQQ